jgi:NAD(P)-dependent dehydrogenase (short-subunit alcohol dehydrogenase family)
MMSLAGKIVLLTNASTSFAYSVARHLISCGAKILLTDDDQKRLDYIISGLKQEGLKNENLIGIAANLSVADGRKELFDKVIDLYKSI